MSISAGDRCWLRYTRIAPTEAALQRIMEFRALPPEEQAKHADEPVELERLDGWAEGRVHRVIDHYRCDVVVRDPERQAERLLPGVEIRDRQGRRNPNLWVGENAPDDAPTAAA
jgi:hypothetical protein